MSDTLNLVLFSGTADKLHAAATLAAGAAALDRPVNILLQYWALDAFRKEQLETTRGLAWDAMADGASRPALSLFLGRFHPTLLHLPVALVLLALMQSGLCRFLSQRAGMPPGRMFAWGFGLPRMGL